MYTWQGNETFFTLLVQVERKKTYFYEVTGFCFMTVTLKNYAIKMSIIYLDASKV